MKWLKSLSADENLRRKNESLKKENQELLEIRGNNAKAISGLRKALLKCKKEKQEMKKMFDGLLGKALERIERHKKDIEALMNKIKQLMSPPNLYAYFWRMPPAGKPGEVDVILDGKPRRVFFVIEGKDPGTVKPGSQVLLGGAGAVIEVIDSCWPWGREVRFREKLGEDTALVFSEANAVEQCYLSPELKDAKLKEGDSLLDCGGVLVKVLPKTEEKEHFKDADEITDFNWSRVGGISRAVRRIQRMLLPFKEAEVYRNKLKCRDFPKGVILHGPSGCGKTLVAKCIAADLARYRGLKCYFMQLVGAELSNKFVGATSEKIRELFARAKEKSGKDALVMIFIDEIDSLFRSRSPEIMDKEPWQAEHIGQFNSILDGMDPLDNVLVVGASNHKHLIDAAILRPGRLGRDVYIPPPRSRKDIREILEIYLAADLPFSKKYFENDEYSYRNYFEGGKQEVVVLNKDPKKVRDHFIDVIIKRLLYAGNPIKVVLEDDGKEVIEVDNRFRALTESGEKDVYLKDQLSGAILKYIVETAKEIALERYIKQKNAGGNAEPDMIKKDFFKAIDEEFQRLKHGFKQLKEKNIGFGAPR